MKCTERGAKTFGNCLKNTTEQKALFDLIFLSVKITVHKCILFTWPPSLRVLSLRVRNRIAREDHVHNADWLKKPVIIIKIWGAARVLVHAKENR